MKTRLRVNNSKKRRELGLHQVNTLSYPDSASQKVIKRAGGIEKLTDEQRAALVIKDVPRGEWCDDMPEEPRAKFIEVGKIEVVTMVLAGLSAAKAVAHVETAGPEDLDALEAEERGAEKSRKIVLKAIAAARGGD